MVTLVDGEEYHVKAVNEFHAGSMVVYRMTPETQRRLDGATGQPLEEVVVHRDNISSIRLKLEKAAF